MRPRSLIPHAPALAFVAATFGFGVGNVLAKVILERGVDPLETLPASVTALLVASLPLTKSRVASRVALMPYLVPLVGVAGGILILGEPVGPRLLIGGALILAGLVLADRTERRAHAALRT